MEPSPEASPSGIRKLICNGETKRRGAVFSTPLMSFTITVLPANIVGSGRDVAISVVVARLAPNAAAIESLGEGPGAKLAAETVVTGRVGCGGPEAIISRTSVNVEH